MAKFFTVIDSIRDFGKAALGRENEWISDRYVKIERARRTERGGSIGSWVGGDRTKCIRRRIEISLWL